MQYHWLRNRVHKGEFIVIWRKGTYGFFHQTNSLSSGEKAHTISRIFSPNLFGSRITKWSCALSSVFRHLLQPFELAQSSPPPLITLHNSGSFPIINTINWGDVYWQPTVLFHHLTLFFRLLSHVWLIWTPAMLVSSRSSLRIHFSINVFTTLHCSVLF